MHLPLTVALPIMVSLAMFVVAVGSTQIGVEVLRRSSEQVLRNQAYVFLDAVAGGIADRIPEGRAGVERQIESILTFRSALREEAIAVRWSDQSGVVQSTFMGERGQSTLEDLLERNFLRPAGFTEIVYDEEAQTAKVVRTYGEGDDAFAISALFDSHMVDDTRRNASFAAIVIDVVVAFFAALVTFLVSRAMLRPLGGFTFRLAAEGGNTAREALRRGPELSRLEHALSLREQSEAEKALTAVRLAEQERDALLARLAASIAHEVRNPLAGLINAVSTLRRYGHQERVREQTAEILDQGLTAIGRVVDVTLSTYRRRASGRILTGQEIRDLELLVGAEAKSCDVDLVWNVDPAARIETDADAVRQILINLLLNAIRAIGESGTVTVEVDQVPDEPGSTAITVMDTGPGMPPAIIASLVSGKLDALPHERGLGIWMIASLVEQIGARLSVSSGQEVGTEVRITLPRPGPQQAPR